MSGSGSDAERRVWSRLPPEARRALEHELSGTDLQTLWLAVARSRAASVTPSDLVRRWESDRFVRPAAANPRRLAALEARLWETLPEAFAGVELSPVAPLATCAAVAGVSENRILATARMSEVVSDSSNALALEAAVRRRRGPQDAEVHLATIQRQLRAQLFGAGVSAHFRLMALVSSARDRGSRRTEADMLSLHLRHWLRVLGGLIGDRDPVIELSVFDDPALAERLQDTVLPRIDAGACRVIIDPQRSRGRGYYRGLAMRLAADGGQREIGDGGFTDWTAKLISDAKERCLVSCLATERLTELVG